MTRRIGNWSTRQYENKRHPLRGRRRTKKKNHRRTRRFIQKQPHYQRSHHRHPAEKDVKPIQQKGRPVPIHFQKFIREELEKLIEKGHLKKADKTTENCFISPTVITIRKDKSVKIALDSRKLNEACINRKAAMPNIEELISKISAKITKDEGEIWMSKIDLDYAYGQAKLSKEAAKHCVFSIIGGDFTGHYRFKKVFTAYRISPRCFKNI